MGITAIVWIASKKWNKGLQAGYMFLILAVIVLSRAPGKLRYELIPFWSYRVPSLRQEILLNVVMFIPVGLLGGKWSTVGMAAIFSAAIELAQLISCRGLFEFDDIIHNALGAAIGVAAVMLVKRMVGKSESF